MRARYPDVDDDFATEPCERCTRRGREFNGRWYHLKYLLHGLGHHDAPVFVPHTVQSCRAYRRGVELVEAQLADAVLEQSR